MCSAVAVDDSAHAPLAVGSVLDLLDAIERMNESESGVFLVGSDPRRMGAVFVQHKRLCWAGAPGLERRLTDLLRESAHVPMDPPALSRLVRECHAANTPFGESLVSRGWVTAEGFAEALRRHTGESLVQLFGETTSIRWVPRERPEYDPRFSFTAADALVTIGATREGLLDYSMHEASPWLLKHEGGVVLYLRTDVGVLPVAKHGVPDWSARELWDIGRWVTEYHDMATAIDAEAWLTHAALSDGTAVVITRAGSLYHLLSCRKPAQFSRIVYELRRERAQNEGA